MPSNKPKVFAYLPQELYDRVSEFKLQHQLSSDSQALIAILTEFFDCPKSKAADAINSSNALEQRVEQLERMFDSLNLMVLGLLHAEPLGELEETNGSVPSELLGELEETNGSVPGELIGGLEETNGSVPGELIGGLEEINGSVPGELIGGLEETNGSVPGELIGGLEETNGSVPGELIGGLEETNGSVPGELFGELEEAGKTDGSVPDSDQHFVICLIDKHEPTNPKYWVSQKLGFTEDLGKAKTYHSEGSLKRQKNRLEKAAILASNERLSYKTFGELKQMQARVVFTN